MGAKESTVGGGSARGVSSNISDLLNQGLTGGGYSDGRQQGAMDNWGRSDPMSNTMDIRGAIAQLLSGGAGMANGAQAIAANRREENVGDIRSRYALGGTGYGTPAAVGEARFLGEFDPQVAAQVGGMQLDSMSKGLGFLFPLLQQAYGLGTPQAQTVMKKGFLGNAIDAIGGLAGAAAPFFGGGFGGSGGSAAEGMVNDNFGLNPPASLSMHGMPTAPSMNWDNDWLTNLFGNRTQGMA